MSSFTPMKPHGAVSRRVVHFLVVASLVVGLALVESWALGADPFYENLLAKGTDQYNRRDFAAAARTLRLACFGLLEEPERLADGLVRLGLAQGAAGERDAFAETFRRLVEVEERFGAYTKASIPEAVRGEFERLARAVLPPATLAAAAGFAHLAAPQSGGRAATPPPGAQAGGAARPAPAPTADQAEELKRAKALLVEGRIVESYERARTLADASPAWREAQLVAAEAAYRLARWAEAVAYFARAGDPGEEQPLLLFYWAVSLYEAGDRARAATVLRRALPRIKHTEYVDAYEAKILGTP